MAHIHFGASKTNGGVIVFLCGSPKPACPGSGTITGTITAADVSILPADNPNSVIPQGIQPGGFGALLKAIRSGNTYVNVHTPNFPAGEIRGQVKGDPLVTFRYLLSPAAVWFPPGLPRGSPGCLSPPLARLSQ